MIKKTTQLFLLAVRNALDPLLNFREVSVLCYHSISNNEHETTVAPNTFENHLEVLKRRGHSFVSLAQVVSWMEGKAALPRKAVALTFDDGYADFENTLLPLLKKHNVPAALFVIGDPIATGWKDAPPFLSSEALLRLQHESLVEVGYHTRSHPNLEELSDERLMAEIRPSTSEKFFAYPGGKYSEAAIEAVKNAGYVAAFSIKPTLVTQRSDRYVLPRNVVLKNTTPWELHFLTTKAVEWYRAAWRLAR